MKVSLIVAAAGESRRFGEDKITCEILGKPLIFYTLLPFVRTGRIDEIIVATRKELFRDVRKAKAYLGNVPMKIVEGGCYREQSVKRGLEKARGDIILVHDGARPNTSEALINRILDLLETKEAVVPAVNPVETTLRESETGVKRLPRDKVLLVQTPQGFRREILEKAFEMAGERLGEFSDESTLLAEVLGVIPDFIEGDRENLKITYRSDIEIFKNYMMGEVRSGFGYDLHRLEEGRKLYLGGELIDTTYGAVAHSDGDTLLHSIIDAMLGASGLGDIGKLFPDTSPEFKGISSLYLLERTNKLLEENGFWVLNIDSTVLLEKPLISPYIDRMKGNISEVLGLPVERISIKGKRGEGIGAVGERKAIVAMSSVMVARAKTKYLV